MRRLTIERSGNAAVVSYDPRVYRDMGGLGIVDLIAAGVAAAGTAASIAAQAVMQKKAQKAAEKAQKKSVAEAKRQEAVQRENMLMQIGTQAGPGGGGGGFDWKAYLPYIAIGGAGLVALMMFTGRRK